MNLKFLRIVSQRLFLRDITAYCKQIYQRAEKFIFSGISSRYLWLKRFELLSFSRLGRPTPSRSKSPSNISLHINAGPPLHYTRSEWQQEFLILCWYKVLMHCSVTQKCSVYSILWWSKILCVCVLNSVALLQNPISKGMCERLCVRVKPQGALTQAEDPVKCFIFRCIKLFHVLLSRTLSTGTPLSSTFFNCT